MESVSTGPSTYTRALGISRRALPEYENSTPMPPSMSTQESAFVAPVRADSAYSSSLRSVSARAICLSSTARSWKVSAPMLACPTVRAYSSAAPRSSPAVLTRVTGSPVEASRTSVASGSSAGVHHAPWT